MKFAKKLLAAVLSLAMIFAYAPATETVALAEGHVCTHEGYTAWNSDSELPTAAGKYYLTKDITLALAGGAIAWECKENISLCLNGHTIDLDGKYDIRVPQAGVTLNIDDCSTVYDEKGLFVSGGKIINGSNGYYGCFFCNVISNINIKGIEITGCRATGGADNYTAGAICARLGATINIEGCYIHGNTSKYSGAGLAVLEKACINVRNTRIEDNTATTNGGAAHVGNTDGNVLYMENCVMSGNKGSNSSAVYCTTKAALTLKNCDVQNNTTTAKGNYTGAVYVIGTCVLQGANVIVNNKDAAGSKADFCIQNSTASGATDTRTFIISNSAADANVNIKYANFRSGYTGEIATVTEGDLLGTYTWQADSAKVLSKAADGKVYLTAAAQHTHDGITFDAWTESASLPKSGSYYLTKDVTTSAQNVLNGNLNLCLNGHTVTATASNYGTVFVIPRDKDYTVNLINCSADGGITDTTEGGRSAFLIGSYTANASGGDSKGTINIKNVKFTNVKGTASGTCICVQGATKLNLDGCSFTGCETAKSGAVLFVSSSASVSAKNTAFAGNKATLYGGVLYSETTGALTFDTCTFTGNEAAEEAGVAYIKNGSVNFKNCQVTGNTGKNGSALSLFGTKAVLEDTTVTGNNATNGYGAVHINRLGSPSLPVSLTIKGNTKVTGNTAKTTTAQNIFLRNNDCCVTFDNPGTDAKVGVSMENARLNAENFFITAEGIDASAYLSLVESDNKNYTVGTESNRIRLMSHSHEGVNYQAWTSATSLPKSGKYYLTTDVTVSAQHVLAGNLDLCLNGHTITATTSVYGSVFVIGRDKDYTVNLTNCSDQGGITDMTEGGRSAFLIGSYAANASGGASKGTINISNVKFFDIKATASGGCICVQGETVLNLKDCTFTGCESAKSGAALFLADKTQTTVDGCVFENNKAVNNGVAIYATTTNAGDGKLSVKNSTFKNNTAGGEAAINATRFDTVIADSEISGNTGKNCSGITIIGGSAVLDNAVVTGNKATNSYGAVNVNLTDGNPFVIKGTTVITDNTAGEGNAQNLFLRGSDFYLDLTDLCSDAKIGLTLEAARISAGLNYITAAGKDSSAFLSNFTSDSQYKNITVKDGRLLLEVSGDHTHCVCADGSGKGCGHSETVWTAWESKTSLPTQTGNYYLTSDIRMSGQATVTGDADIKICLNGHSVKPLTGARVILIRDGAKVTFTDCKGGQGKIYGGSKSYGAFVSVQAGAVLNIYNITVTDCDAAGSDCGAIYTPTIKDGETAPVINMYSGTIKNCKANNSGAVLINGGTTADKGPVFNMYGGTVEDCTAEANGGAFFVGKYGVLNLYGGTIKNNEAAGTSAVSKSAGLGGAIYVASGTVNIKDGAIISGNKAASNGGAILATGTDCVVTMDGGVISGNSAKNGGGIITQTRSKFVLNGGSIENNNVSVCGGGAYISTNTTFEMNGGTFKNNKAASTGGAIYILRTLETNLNGGTVTGNSAKSGGGIVVSGESVTLKGMQVTYNTAKENGGGIIVQQAKETKNGETIIHPGGFKMTGGKVSNNSANNAGGILVQSKGSSFRFTGGTISNNKSKLNGAGVYISTDTTFEMTGGRISNNRAENRGGGLNLLRCKATLSGGSISGNYALYYGGGINTQGAKLYLTGTSILENTADTEKGTGGGGICTGNITVKAKDGTPTVYKSYTKLAGSLISGNQAKNGGGMLVQSIGNVFDFTGGTIEHNKATAAGGGLYISKDTTINMSGGKVQYNEAVNSGGINQYRAYGNYTGGMVRYNKAEKTAGGMLVSCLKDANYYAELTGMEIYGNEALTCGGMVCQGYGLVKVHDSKFYDNVSENSGGAVYISTNSRGEFDGTSFTNNKSTKLTGGGIYTAVTSTLSVTGCEFTGNTAGTKGGAMNILCKNGLITDTIVKDNYAKESGGGISGYKPGTSFVGLHPSVTLDNVTVENNKTDGTGGGVMMSIGMNSTIKNCLIQNNEAGLEGGGIWAQDDFELDGTVVKNNKSGGEGYAVFIGPADYDGRSYSAGIIRFNGDTQVTDNRNGDMYLSPEVAAIINSLGKNAKIHLVLDSGILTNRVFGEYNYEGGNQDYVITYGDKSVTDPEAFTLADGVYEDGLPEIAGEPERGDEEPTIPDEQDEGSGNVLLFGGIAAGVIAAATAAGIIIAKKKSKKDEETK